MNFKFSLTFISLVTCAITSKAQITKGSILAGTSIGYKQIKSKNSNGLYTSNIKTTSFVVSPSAGVAIKENLVAGIRLDYSRSMDKIRYDYANYSDIENKNYGGGVFLRQYVPLINRLYVFGEGSISYANIRQKSTQGSTTGKTEIKSKGWSTGLGLTPGISYGISKKFQIEGGFNSLLNVSYAKSKTTYANNEISKQDVFSGGVGDDNGSMFFVGFRVIM